MISNSWIVKAGKEKVISFFDIYKNLWVADKYNIESLIYNQTCGTFSQKSGISGSGKTRKDKRTLFSHRLPE